MGALRGLTSQSEVVSIEVRLTCAQCGGDLSARLWPKADENRNSGRLSRNVGFVPRTAVRLSVRRTYSTGGAALPKP